MRPDPFSNLGLYGSRDVFERRASEGYTEVSFGGGPWVGERRIVAMWVFYHPNGKIATFEHRKGFAPDGLTTRRIGIGERFYSPQEFRECLEKQLVILSSRTPLREIMTAYTREN